MKINPSTILDRIRAYHEQKPFQVKAEEDEENGTTDNETTNDESNESDDSEGDDSEDIDLSTPDGLRAGLRVYAEQVFIISEMTEDIENSEGDDRKQALENIKEALTDAKEMFDDLKVSLTDYLKQFSTEG